MIILSLIAHTKTTLIPAIHTNNYPKNPLKSSRNHRKTTAQGFSLIELMIVVAVIGVLTTIALPQYQNYVKKAALSSALASVTAQKIQVEESIAVDGDFPEDSSTFPIGSIRLAPTNNNGVEGAISAVISSGPAQGITLSLQRDANGSWQCNVQGDNIDDALLPTTCKSQDISGEI